MQLKEYVIPRIKGMSRDIDISLALSESNDYAYENMNIRITPLNGENEFAMSNEKGPLATSVAFMSNSSTYLDTNEVVCGTCVLNNNLILFTAYKNTDNLNCNRIICVTKLATAETYEVLWTGNLNFDMNAHVQTLASYESENIQKVYWVDDTGNNQPRVINIKENNLRGQGYLSNRTSNYFDFTRKLPKGIPSIKVTKRDSGGSFGGEAVQYAFTLVTRYALESAIFYQSEIHYTDIGGRAGSGENSSNNSFAFNISWKPYILYSSSNVNNEYVQSYNALYTDLKEFDYIRVYSIRRTSINDLPTVWRVKDIPLSIVYKPMASTNVGTNIILSLNILDSFDDGITGEIIASTDLLFKNGKRISAKTIALKDGTLFLGNVKELSSTLNIDDYTIEVTRGTTLSLPDTLYIENLYLDLIPKFMPDCKYVLGVLILDDYGNWSNVVEVDSNAYPGNYRYTATIKDSTGSVALVLMRTMFRLLNSNTRNVLCLAVVLPTMHITDTDKGSNDMSITPTYMPSYFFRLIGDNWFYIYSVDDEYGVGLPNSRKSEFCWNSADINLKVRKNNTHFSLHSPDIEFGLELPTLDFSEVTVSKLGYVNYVSCNSDFRMTLETTLCNEKMTGVINYLSDERITAGFFYQDTYAMYLSDKGVVVNKQATGDYDEKSNLIEQGFCQYMIYPWHHTGCLINYTGVDKGGVLKTKQLTNFMKLKTSIFPSSLTSEGLSYTTLASTSMRYIQSTQGATYALEGKATYQGCINQTLVSSKYYESAYLSNEHSIRVKNQTASKVLPKTKYELGQTTDKWSISVPSIDSAIDYYKRLKNGTLESGWYLKNWASEYDTDKLESLSIDKSLFKSKKGISFKYKTPPHIVAWTVPVTGSYNIGNYYYEYTESSLLNLLMHDLETARENKEAPLVNVLQESPTTNSNPYIPSSLVALGYTEFSIGDTFVCPYECIKCYPYASSDENLILDVATFPIYSYVNTFGRYDINYNSRFNIATTPDNTNLINFVYSQLNNFFEYDTIDTDYIQLKDYPNYITWTLTKETMAATDEWTHITMASNLELDGDKGLIRGLVKFNDALMCFLDSGISLIIYNELSAISTTSGIPIELANSGKVTGKRYLSSSYGTINNKSICTTDNGIYFVDSANKGLCLASGDGILNISKLKGFDYLFSNKIQHNNNFYSRFRTFFDKPNNEIYFINGDLAICWNENLLEFTSFYNYEGTMSMDSVENITYLTHISSELKTKLYRMHEGDYNNFFGTNKDFYSTLKVTPMPNIDKIFTNVDINADVLLIIPDNDIAGYKASRFDNYNYKHLNMINGMNPLLDYVGNSTTTDASDSRYNKPKYPLTHFRMFNEYQDTTLIELTRDRIKLLWNKSTSSKTSFRLKFRTWRIDVPRSKMVGQGTNLSRNRRDRIRNPWVYMTLYYDTSNKFGTTDKNLVVIHNINVLYYE